MKTTSVDSAPAKKYVNTDFETVTLDDSSSPIQAHQQWWVNVKYIVIGIAFGILLIKSEVVSWFRIQEMFRFQSFHMYGIIGSAIVVGIISILVIKKFKLTSAEGEKIELPRKEFHKGQVYGGLLFGLGWALTGACPGPLFAQIGAGATVVIVTLLSAVAGTFVYGWVRDRLPH